MYSQDLLCANKNIIVSSPSLSGDRVVEFTKLIKEKMESGVEVTIVSWMPDKIRFGSSNYRMQLLEEMRQSGFYLKLLFCKWVVIIRLFTMFRAHCIPISHFFWR